MPEVIALKELGITVELELVEQHKNHDDVKPFLSIKILVSFNFLM